MSNATKNFQLVEVQTTSTTQIQFPLKDDEILGKVKKIRAIEAYKVGTVTNVPRSGRAIVSDAVFKKAFLVLVTADGKEVINKIPLPDLDRAGNTGMIFQVDIPPIAPSKCYIEVATVAGLSAAESFLLGFHYEN